MAVLGLGQHHSRQEGAQGERQPGRLRHPARGEHDQQHGEREQLPQPAMGDLVKQRTQQPATGGQHDDDRQDAADDGQHTLAKIEMLASGGQR